MNIKNEHINTGNSGFDFFRFGTGNRPLIVLPGLSIKSILLYKDAVADTLGLFGDDFEVFVFDRFKEYPPVYTIENMARDYIEAFDSMGLKDISIYGISQGGMIALTIAILRPDLVKSMVIGSSAARLPESTKDLFSELLAAAKDKREQDLIEGFGSKVYSKSFYEAYKDAIVAASANITDSEYERFIISTEKLDEYDVFGKLGSIKCPVLVMAGSEDEIIPKESATEMAEAMKCELYVFDGYGHAVYDENPEFKEKAKEFFRKSLL